MRLLPVPLPRTSWRGVAFLGAALNAAGCTAPAFLAHHHTPWGSVALLTALYAGCEQLPRCRPPHARGGPAGPGAFFPVLLAGVCLLPPAAAALVAVPGALLAPVGHRPAGPRRGWRAVQLAVACWAAGWVYEALCDLGAFGAFGAFSAFGGPGGRAAHGAPGAPDGARLSATAHALAPGAAPAAPDLPCILTSCVAASVAFCAVLTALDGAVLAAVTGSFPAPPIPWRRISPRVAWGGLFVRSLAPVAAHALAGLLMAVLWRSAYGPPAALLVLVPMALSQGTFARCHRERAAHEATVGILVRAVAVKDGYTWGHSERVGLASVMIAQELGMDRERVETLRCAGILHDVGKLGVPTRLLRKDGPLTAQERRIIQLHPEYGDEMVRGIGSLGEARAAILHHHECVDGSGYPHGLSGPQIPECARVVAVADAFDAMTSTRPYRTARPVPAAMDELTRCAGTQFDARMVGALARAIARYGWCPSAPVWPVRDAAVADRPVEDPGDQRRNVPPQRSSEGARAPGAAETAGRRSGSAS